jgi:hypothetical protein
MKYLKDYVKTNTDIYVETEEEYVALVPLLNEVFSGWRENGWERYAKANERYIHLNSDSIGKRVSNHDVIPAREFIGPKEEIINEYPIY